MMELYFDIAGISVRVSGPDGAFDISGSVLERFLTNSSIPEYAMDFSLTEALSPAEGELVFDSAERRVYAGDAGYVSLIGDAEKPFLRIERNGDTAKVQVLSGPDRRIHGKQILRAMEAEHLITVHEGILFHSAFISYQGRGILFTAPSGTGKSTQAELWRSLRGAEVRNGDRSAIRKSADGFQVYGVPFCGSSDICHAGCLPLQAIVYLSQAPENSIRPLSGLQAFRAVWEGCSVHTWNRQEVALGTQTVSELIRQVPVYHLACRPDAGAVEALEAELVKLR